MIGLKKDNTKLTEQNALTREAMLAYVAGTLSAEDKQQFEELLKEDPFAQDALEGLQSTAQLTAATAIAGINKKVRERTGLQQKKTIQLHWTSYAWAAVLLGLLIGIGFVMVNMLGNNNEQMAMDKPSTERAEEVLFEQKTAQQTLVAADTQPATDSLSVSLRQSENISANSYSTESGIDKNLEPTKPATTTSEIANAARKENLAAAKTITGASATPAVSSAGIQPQPVSITPAENGKGKSGGMRFADDGKENTAAETKAEKKTSNKISESKEDKAASEPMPSTQKVIRGSIIEREETDQKRVVTIDGAMKNFNSGNYKQSSDDFDAILREQPQNADALYFGGISDYINGNAKKSEKNFDKLLKDGSKFQEGSKWYKANILLRKGKKEEAKKLLDELAGTGGSYKERAIKKKAELEF